MQIPRKRGRPSKADVAAEAKAAAEAEAKAAEVEAAEAAEVEAAVEVVTIPVVSVSPARKRRKQEVLRAMAAAAEEEESDKASTIVAIGEVVPESERERVERERKMQAYEMEAKVNALVCKRIYKIRNEIADELIGSTEIRDAIANELIGCITAILERTTRAIADRYNNEHRPLEHWID